MKTGKRISTDQLKPGMFVVAMDQPWYKTPYLLHKFLVKSKEEIAELIRHGVREVTIDPRRGVDLVDQPAGQTDATESAAGCSQAAGSQDEKVREGTRPDHTHGRLRCTDRSVYEEAEAALDRVFEDLHSEQPPTVPALKVVVGGVLDRILQDRTAMMTQVLIQQMGRFDRSLASHAIDTCILSLIFASEYGVAREELEQTGIGALLHDVGYVRLPRNLYRSRHQLASHEQELLHQHPRLGQGVLAEVKDLSETVRRIVGEHHERMDGSGFPEKLSGSALSPLGQLVGLVDTYESLTNHRAGHPPLSPFEAIRKLFMMGETRRFDKALIEVAVKCLGVYPIGSVVKLNTGECAVVVGIHPEHRLKPMLKVISGSRGETYTTPLLIDLAAAGPTEPTRVILSALDPTAERINISMYLDSTPQEGAA